MIADAAHVRALGNFPDALEDAQIDPHLRAARRRLRRWVGSAVYDEAEADAGPMAKPQTEALKDAEAYLAISIGVRSWNVVIENVGNAGVSGLTESGKIGDDGFRYLSQGAVEKMQEDFMLKAEASALDWIIEDYPTPESSPAYDDEGEAI